MQISIADMQDLSPPLEDEIASAARDFCFPLDDLSLIGRLMGGRGPLRVRWVTALQVVAEELLDLGWGSR